MKFKRQIGQEVSVNLTPLIDVVFLLLIFFMVSTTFTRESRLQLRLPEASGEAPISAEQILEIQIDQDGQYAIGGRVLSDTSLASLRKVLLSLAEGDLERPLLVSADAQAPHQAVVRVLDAAGQIGFSKLSLATVEAVEQP